MLHSAPVSNGTATVQNSTHLNQSPPPQSNDPVGEKDHCPLSIILLPAGQRSLTIRRARSTWNWGILSIRRVFLKFIIWNGFERMSTHLSCSQGEIEHQKQNLRSTGNLLNFNTNHKSKRLDSEHTCTETSWPSL